MVNKTPKVSSEDAKQAAMALLGQDGAFNNLTAKVFCNRKAISKTAKIVNDTAFYLFNAPGNNGYAIIAADMRVPQQVLAYSDNGNFDSDTTNPAVAFFLDLTKEYVENCIETAEMQKDSLTESIYNKLGIPDDTKGLRTKKYHEKILLTNLCHRTVTRTNTAEVKPLVRTEWHQQSPFNDNCNGDAAGCVAIATSQLMTYWHYPQTMNNKIINWNLIDTKNILETNDNYCKQVAVLVRIVGEELNTNYGTTSSANRHNVLKYLRNINYSVPNQLYDYKYEKVTASLNNGCPVFMAGKKNKVLGGLWYKDGHAWLVDGYLEQTFCISSTLTYIVIDVDDNNHTETHYEYGSESKCDYYKYLHINWGWGTNYNGYYLKDVFNAHERVSQTNDGSFISDTTKSHNNYRYNLEIAPDIRPKR